MKPVLTRLLALAEVGLVVFGVLKLAGLLVMASGVWQAAGSLERNILGHLVMLAVPLMWLLLLRRDFGAYGLSLRQPLASAGTAMTIFLPVALASALSGFVDYKSLPGAIVLAAANVAALVWVSRSLRGRGDVNEGLLTIALFVPTAVIYWIMRGATPDPSRSVLSFVCYAFFVGPAEEVLYRGFVQSRLNQAFGANWLVGGVRVGWGLVLASLLFGFSHVLNINAATGETGWYWGWGLWTSFSGLLLGYVRERTGGVLVPAILHGLPQALASSLLGL